MIKNFSSDKIEIMVDGKFYDYFGIITIASEELNSANEEINSQKNYTFLVKSELKIKLNTMVIFENQKFRVKEIKIYKDFDSNSHYYKLTVI